MLLGFPCSLFLCVGQLVPCYDKSGNDDGQAERQRCHECSRRRIGDTQRGGEAVVGCCQQVLYLRYRYKPEGAVLVQGIENLLKPHSDSHHALYTSLYFHQVFILPSEQGHDARGCGERSGQAVYTRYEALQVRVVIGEDIGLGTQIAEGVGQLCGLLCHLPVLLGVLLAVQAHACHVVLQLAQLARQAFVALPVALLLLGQRGEDVLVLLQGFLGGVQFRQRRTLRIAGRSLLVGLLQSAHICLHLLDHGFLLPYLVGKALIRRCCLLL